MFGIFIEQDISRRKYGSMIVSPWDIYYLTYMKELISSGPRENEARRRTVKSALLLILQTHI